MFGCDICQDVCPYNAEPLQSDVPAWRPRPEFDRPTLAALWLRSDEKLEQQLESSAMSRAGLIGFRRNVAVALGNSGIQEAASVLDESTDPEALSRQDPTVAEHVTWARARLGACSSGKQS